MQCETWSHSPCSFGLPEHGPGSHLWQQYAHWARTPSSTTLICILHAWLHFIVYLQYLQLTCAGVWMTATLSKVTIPSTPGRLSTFHPSWDLSVVWQSTRVWWGSMLGELASTKLDMQIIAIVRSQRKIDFNNTSSELQYCLVLLHFDKLAWFE